MEDSRLCIDQAPSSSLNIDFRENVREGNLLANHSPLDHCEQINHRDIITYSKVQLGFHFELKLLLPIILTAVNGDDEAETLPSKNGERECK